MKDCGNVTRLNGDIYRDEEKVRLDKTTKKTMWRWEGTVNDDKYTYKDEKMTMNMKMMKMIFRDGLQEEVSHEAKENLWFPLTINWRA